MIEQINQAAQKKTPPPKNKSSRCLFLLVSANGGYFWKNLAPKAVKFRCGCGLVWFGFIAQQHF